MSNATDAQTAPTKSAGKQLATKLREHPIAYPKQAIYDFFMGHEAALMVVSAVGVALGVTLLVWFLAFSGMNEPVQFIYDSF